MIGVAGMDNGDGAADGNNFSPTSSFASVRMLLVLAAMYDLAITALDVEDAFLMVPQMEILYVQIPQWIRQWTASPNTHWLLTRCLPGYSWPEKSSFAMAPTYRSAIAM